MASLFYSPDNQTRILPIWPVRKNWLQSHIAQEKRRLLYGAVTPVCRFIAFLDDVMINPFRNQTPRLIDGGFGMMDTVEGRTGVERGDIICPDLFQLMISRDHSPFAVSRYPTAIDHFIYP